MKHPLLVALTVTVLVCGAGSVLAVTSKTKPNDLARRFRLAMTRLRYCSS